MRRVIATAKTNGAEPFALNSGACSFRFDISDLLLVEDQQTAIRSLCQCPNFGGVAHPASQLDELLPWNFRNRCPGSTLLDEPVFAPLVVCEVPEVQPEPDIAASAEVIRIVSGEVRIELAPGTPALRVAEIVHALGAAPC